MKCGSDLFSRCGENDCLEELGQALLKFHLEYSKQVSELAEVLSASGEYGILYRLYHDRTCITAGELAESLGLTPGRVANVLKALEKKKRIVRKRDPLDKRRTLVSLTEEGAMYICHLHHQSQRYCCQLVQQIGEDKARTFIEITQELFAASKEIAAEKIFAAEKEKSAEKKEKSAEE